jgi:hypothetical protein
VGHPALTQSTQTASSVALPLLVGLTGGWYAAKTKKNIIEILTPQHQQRPLKI